MPRRAPGCASSSPAAITATWAGSPALRRGAATRRCCGPRRAPSSCSVSITRRSEDPLAAHGLRDRGAISVYARGRDYHDTLKRRLKALAQWIEARWPGGLKVFVDTAPVMEKPLAEQAGLGWQGKHTNLVSRDFGSWLFLGEIFLSLALEPDAPEADHCGVVPALSRCLPDRGVSGTLPARCAALHLVSDDRAQGDDPARAAPADRQSDLWLRRLPRGLPVEQICPRPRRSPTFCRAKS